MSTCGQKREFGARIKEGCEHCDVFSAQEKNCGCYVFKQKEKKCDHRQRKPAKACGGEFVD